MGDSDDRIAQWLRGIEGAGCVRVEARHMVSGAEGGSVVGTFERAGEGEGSHFAAAEVSAKLESDAESVGGVQRYLLLAYREGSKAPRDRLPLRLDGGADGDPSASEPASLRGALSQQMRHNEAILRMVGSMFGSTLDAMSKQNRAIAEALEKSNEERVEMWGVLRQMSTHDRDKATSDHELALQSKREDVLVDSVKLIMPALIGKLAPSHELKETTLTRLVESLTDEQRAAVFGVLTPDQQIALGALLDDSIQKQQKSEKAATDNGQSQKAKPS
jgi:hypothetical protein